MSLGVALFKHSILNVIYSKRYLRTLLFSLMANIYRMSDTGGPFNCFILKTRSYNKKLISMHHLLLHWVMVLIAQAYGL